ncbi:hypothetical protein RHABOEDO_001707 [Candidatus Rhabdochlamydia oedothoracis]|uniref:DUF4116 domain-containing protein n=1 Tax=Candidatus Rhabdochlamydia oedothoracis TaxID=2720720 RepID=A0ABX8V710_9BACT|nr:hypothetical protein [Candidatus Rhabdochlamydia oedothoracis]QYF49377.1 hypothetical protein RHABOEDO_001707 [Candidatus Rhabdochlamydia oedothoracis]
MVEIAKLAAQSDGGGTSQYIKEYGITDPETLIEIAKLAAQNNIREISEFIQNYGIKDQKFLMTVAEPCVKKDREFSKFIQNYKIVSEKDRIDLAKLAVQKDAGTTSEFIGNYKITDQDALIAIAKDAVQKDARASMFIKSYKIKREEARVDIAKFAAQNNGVANSLFINSYDIIDKDSLVEIAQLSIRKSIASNTISEIWEYLPKYDISDTNIHLNSLQLLCACYYSLLGNKTNATIEGFIKQHYAEIEELDLFPNFQKKLEELGGEILKATEELKQEKLKKEKQRTQERFSLIARFCKEKSIVLESDIQDFFIKILKHRNPKEACFLIQVLMENLNKPSYFSNYQLLISKENKKIEHLILPMIIINQIVTESDQKEDSLQNAQKIREFLAGSAQRASLRDAKGFLPNLLQALIALSSYSSVSSEKKLYLLKQCFSSSLEKPHWEKSCKQSLDIVRVLGDTNLLPNILEKLDENYEFKDITEQFNEKLQTEIFAFNTQISDFHEKYLQVENSLRVPLGLVKYASNVKSHQEPRVSEELQRLVINIFEGTIQKERYQTKNNPHLQRIEKENPKLFNDWQKTQIPEEKVVSNSKKRSINFYAFLQEKILTDKHFTVAPQQLIQYLQDAEKSLPIDNLSKTDQEIFLLCKDLCNSSIVFQKKLELLKKLLNVLYECEFKNDIKALIVGLTTTSQKNVLIVDTDDWQDLFLSGTEVLGSCQRIDGIPSLNVCLMAYVLDGKNRLLAIKDLASGKILARCILRLLWDPKENTPVLFQERIYPFSAPEYEKLLNSLANTRAKALGLELYTLNQRDDLSDKKSSLESLGSCSPYEYADASSGVMKDGEFIILEAKAVALK